MGLVCAQREAGRADGHYAFHTYAKIIPSIHRHIHTYTHVYTHTQTDIYAQSTNAQLFANTIIIIVCVCVCVCMCVCL